jgi:hypothetical protein
MCLDRRTQSADSGSTIYYTHWDGTSWTPPMDIPLCQMIRLHQIRVAIDKQGFIHLVWTGLVNTIQQKPSDGG